MNTNTDAISPKDSTECMNSAFRRKLPESRVRPSLPFLAGTATSCLSLALSTRVPIQEDCPEVKREPTLCEPPGGALLLFLLLNPDFPQRLIQPNLVSRDSWKQILEANLHNVTCFQRTQVVLMARVNGTRDSVACAWNCLVIPQHETHLTPSSRPTPGVGGGSPCPFVSHWSWQIFHLKDLSLQFVSVGHPLLSP